jgi:hypothetical protein
MAKNYGFSQKHKEMNRCMGEEGRQVVHSSTVKKINLRL